MKRKTSKRKIKKTNKSSESLSKEEKIRLRRERLEAKQQAERRRGKIVDFTKMKPGSWSIRNHKIVICGQCGKPGELTEMGLSKIFLHRGYAKPGDMIRNSKGEEVQNIKMTDWHLV